MTMITAPTKSQKNARLLRWPFIRHAGARPNAQLGSQLLRQSALLITAECASIELLTLRNIVDHPAQSPCLSSRALPAALKSP